MHDQSASRISGRTRAAVSAMCVRALRITVLKSAGNFTRDKCHDLSAEKIQRVKCFMFEVRNLLRASNFRTPARPAGFENFRLWSIGGSGRLLCHVRSTPGSRHQAERSACPLCATTGLMHRSKWHHYSITSSARASSVGGTMMPSAFAVFKLITSSSLVGSSTGRSAGFAPLNILSTKTADRRNWSRISIP